MPNRCFAVSFAALACAALVGLRRQRSDCARTQRRRRYARRRRQGRDESAGLRRRAAHHRDQRRAEGLRAARRAVRHRDDRPVSGGELDVWAAPLDHSARRADGDGQISGTSPAGETPTIDLRAAWSAVQEAGGSDSRRVATAPTFPTSSTSTSSASLSDPIPAIYSTWWHTIAAPIDHFSGYAVAF